MNPNEGIIFKKLVTTIERFLQIAREKSMKEKPAIKMSTDLYEDLGIDSLEAMDLVAEIEKNFNISVEAQELLSKQKMSDLVEYLAKIQMQRS